MSTRAEMYLMGLFFLRDVIDLTSTKKQDTYVISSDFYKAFVSFDHKFLKKGLKCSSFSDTFCDRNFALFQNFETAYKFINNIFPLNRGVRQGDPLSLYLFLRFYQ